MREQEVERYLVSMVKAVGGKAYKFVSPGNAGVPDRIVVMPRVNDPQGTVPPSGTIAFVEVKATGKQLRPLQRQKMNELQRLGCQYFVVDSKDAVKEFVGWAVAQ